MAERTISTKLVLQGEKEYRAAMGNINRELKVLDSNLKLVDSTFAGERNTMQALEARHRVLTELISKQTDKLNAEQRSLDKAQEYQRKYAEQAAAARAKLEELNRATDDAGRETEEYKRAAEALNREIAANESAEAQSTKAVENHTIKLNQAQVELNRLNRELSTTDRGLDEARNSADGCARSIDEYGNAVRDAGESTERMQQGINAAASALAGAGVAAAAEEIASAISECVESSIAFESAMAGVAKTTDMTGEELRGMGEDIKALSMQIPIAATEIAGVAESAGQLGVAKDDLVNFTEIMAKLGTATDMSASEAATMLAQFAAVTGMSADKYGNLGSAVVALGNNFATTERNVTEMAQAVAGAGANAGMTEADILAVSTAVSSLGITSAMGGTNLSKLIGDMQMAVETGDNLTAWADVAGMSAAEFSRLWGQDATAALQAFVAGLGNSDKGMLSVLGTLGITEQRTVRMITSLANAERQNGTLSRAITLSNKAWAENNALNKEAAVRYQTTESKVQLYKNSVEALKIEVGDRLTPALGGLADIGAGINEWLADFIAQNEWLVPVITGVVTALGVLAGGVVAVTVVIPALKAAWAALSASFMASPVFLVGAAVAGIAVAIGTAVASSKQAIDDLAEAAANLPDKYKQADADFAEELGSVEGTDATAQALIARLQELEVKQAAEGKLDTREWQEWNGILAALVDTVPEVASCIDLQTGEIIGGTEALIENTEEWKRNAIEQAKQRNMQAKYEAWGAAVGELQENSAKLIVAESRAAEVERKLQNEMMVLGRIVGLTDEQIKACGSDIQAFNQAMAATGKTVGGDQVDAYYAALDALDAYADELGPAAEEIHNLNLAIEAGEEAVAQAQQDIDDYAAAYDGLYGSTDGASTGIRQLTEDEREHIRTLEGIQGEIARTMAEYDEAYKTVLAGISSTVSGFRKIEDPTKVIASQDTKDALDSQLAFLTKYQANMQELQRIANEAGITLDAGLIAQLSDGSEDSAAIVAGMVEGGADAIDEINSKFASVQTGKDSFAKVMADMQTDFFGVSAELTKKMTETVESLNRSDEAAMAARDTMAAFNAELEAGSTVTLQIINYINSLISSLGGVSGGGAPSASAPPTGGGTAHASGLDYVPTDEYPAILHKGERVLTALQARAMDADRDLAGNYPVIDAPTARGGAYAADGGIDYDRLAASLARVLDGAGVYIDGERAGDLLTERVSRNIANV